MLCVHSRTPRMSTLADKRFVLVTGKGGVGKTTVCAAEALALAAKGKRVLVAMCNAKERLSAMLGVGPDRLRGDARRDRRLGRQHAPREGARGVRRSRAPQPRPLQDALRQRVRAHLSSRRPGHAGVVDARQGVVAHDRAARRTDRSSTTSSSSTRRPPATGSTCSACPRSSSTSCRRASCGATPSARGRSFRTATTCAIVLVTLPEEMPTTETIELAARAHASWAFRSGGSSSTPCCRRSSRGTSARRSRPCAAVRRGERRRRRARGRAGIARRASACRPRA